MSAPFFVVRRVFVDGVVFTYFPPIAPDTDGVTVTWCCGPNECNAGAWPWCPCGRRSATAELIGDVVYEKIVAPLVERCNERHPIIRR